MAPLPVNRSTRSRGQPLSGRHVRQSLPNTENTPYYSLESEGYLASSDSLPLPTPCPLHAAPSRRGSVRTIRQQQGRAEPRADPRQNRARTEARGEKHRRGDPENRTGHRQDIQASHRERQRNRHIQRSASPLHQTQEVAVPIGYAVLVIPRVPCSAIETTFLLLSHINDHYRMRIHLSAALLFRRTTDGARLPLLWHG